MKLGYKQHFGIKTNKIWLHRKGERILVGEENENLILDTGMSNIGGDDLNDFQDYMHFGDDASANQLDSGSTTMTQSGTTVTANASIFTAGMVGRLIKPDAGGAETYITSYTSETEVEVTDSQTVAATEFTIWQVNRTTLESEIARTNNITSSVAAFSAGVASLTVTHLSSAVSGSKTVREIGWGNANSATISSRVVISPTISMADGDQLEVESVFEVRMGPSTPVAADITGDEGSFVGDYQTESPAVFGLGSSSSLEPAQSSVRVSLSTSSDALQTLQENPNSLSGTEFVVVPNVVSKSSNPSSPPWQRTWTATFPSGTGNEAGNGTIRSIFVKSDGILQSNNSCARFLMDANQVKTSDQTLVVTLTNSWDRNLSN